MAPWPSPTPVAVVAHHGAHGVVVRHGSTDGTAHGRRWVVAAALMEVEAGALRNVVHQGNDVREVHQVKRLERTFHHATIPRVQVRGAWRERWEDVVDLVVVPMHVSGDVKNVLANFREGLA